MATTEASAGHRLPARLQRARTRRRGRPAARDGRACPPWLTGALVRVTPALLEVGGRRMAHWFDGLAMLNRFGFADGSVSYASRFLESRAYAGRQGGASGATAASPPTRAAPSSSASSQIFSPDMTDNPNVNLARIGERYIAMTETPMPVEFDAETLDTVGTSTTRQAEGHVTTRAPASRPRARRARELRPRFSRVSEYVLYGLPAGRPKRRGDRAHAGQGAGLHARVRHERALPDPRRVPARVNPLKLAFSGAALHRELHVGARTSRRASMVFDRATGELRGTDETDAFFCFHHVNAFERRRRLVLDLCAYADARSSTRSTSTRTRPRGASRPPSCGATASTWRRRVALRAARRRAARAAADRLRPRATRGDYRYAYFTGGRRPDWIDRLVKVDVRDGARSEWHEDGCYPGEPVFVARARRTRPRTAASCCPWCSTRTRPLVPARARRRLVRGGRARRGAAPHPVRLPRPVLPLGERDERATAATLPPRCRRRSSTRPARRAGGDRQRRGLRARAGGRAGARRAGRARGGVRAPPGAARRDRALAETAASRRAPATSARRTRSTRSLTGCSSATAGSTCS